MALKALMLRRSIEKKKAELEELRAKVAEFETRAAELETAINEAETEEQEKAVGEEVEAYEAEKKTHDDAVASLADEVERLERELAEVEQAAPVERSKPEIERRTINMNTAVNYRALPMHQRAFDALPMERRQAIMNNAEVKDFLQRFRGMMGRRDVTGLDLTVPVVFTEIISENQYRYSKLMNRIRVRYINGQARQNIVGTAPEAVWTEMCGAINELNININQITVDGFKVAGFIPVCNSALQYSDIDLAATIIEQLSESIGLAKDKAILYGKGAAYKMPMGIVTRLAQNAKPDNYPADAPAWVDLHTSNIKQIGGEDVTGAAFWSQLMLATGATHNRYARGTMFWAMNSNTLTQLKSKVITFTANGDVAANIFGVLPIITGDVDILEFMPDGDVVGGYGDLYLYASRGEMQIDRSEHVQFILDNTVFRGKELGDGAPIVPGAFVAININDTAVTTAMDFAGDTANDAQVQALAIGSETLTPTFDPATYTYAVTASAANDKVEVTPAQAGAQVAIEYGGKNVRNGGTVTWTADNTAHPLTVTVKQGNAVRVYTVNVTRTGG